MDHIRNLESPPEEPLWHLRASMLWHLMVSLGLGTPRLRTRRAGAPWLPLTLSSLPNLSSSDYVAIGHFYHPSTTPPPPIPPPSLQPPAPPKPTVAAPAQVRPPSPAQPSPAQPAAGARSRRETAARIDGGSTDRIRQPSLLAETLDGTLMNSARRGKRAASCRGGRLCRSVITARRQLPRQE